MTNSIILRTDGSVTVAPKNGPYTFAELQRGVGGDADFVCGTFRGGLLAVIMDEEGKIKGKPVNELATMFAHAMDVIDRSDWIAGNAVLAVPTADGDLLPLSDEQVRAVLPESVLD